VPSSRPRDVVPTGQLAAFVQAAVAGQSVLAAQIQSSRRTR
jgi:hypothetical protein